MELRSFEKPYVALLNSANWAIGTDSHMGIPVCIMKLCTCVVRMLVREEVWCCWVFCGADVMMCSVVASRRTRTYYHSYVGNSR